MWLVYEEHNKVKTCNSSLRLFDSLIGAVHREF